VASLERRVQREGSLDMMLARFCARTCGRRGVEFRHGHELVKARKARGRIPQLTN
jgi:hypothetical protein